MAYDISLALFNDALKVADEWGVYSSTPQAVINDLSASGRKIFDALTATKIDPHAFGMACVELKKKQVKYYKHGADDTEGRETTWSFILYLVPEKVEHERYWWLRERYLWLYNDEIAWEERKANGYHSPQPKDNLS